MASTGRNPEIEEVLGALSFLLSGGGIGQLQTITQELNEVMEGRTGKVRNVLDELNTLVGGLDAQRNDIVQALDSINGLSKTLIAEKKTIGDALDAVGPAIDVMRDQHTQLVQMLSELDKLGVVGTRVVNQTKDDLVAQLRHLEPVLASLADSGDSLVPGLVAAASYPFPIDAATTIRGDFANVVFKMQFNLMPVNQGGLLPTSLDELNTLCLGTPLAPICGPTGEGIDQLCAIVATLDLCSTRVGAAAQPEDEAEPTAEPPVPSLVPNTDPDQGTPAAQHRHRRRLIGLATAARWTSGGWCVMRTGIKFRLLAFAILSAVGIVYIGSSYLGVVDRILGRGYTVHVLLPASGGLFTGSEVTYRGVKIGKVSRMVVEDDGLRVDVALQEDSQVPKSAPVRVDNLTAVGEQYLSFEPITKQGPMLQDGDIVRGTKESLPVAEEDLLQNLSRFISSVDGEELNTVIGELGDMFEGNATPLRSLIDSSQLFLESARENQAPTIDLDPQRPHRPADPGGQLGQHSFLRPRSGRSDRHLGHVRCRHPQGSERHGSGCRRADAADAGSSQDPSGVPEAAVQSFQAHRRTTPRA